MFDLRRVRTLRLLLIAMTAAILIPSLVACATGEPEVDTSANTEAETGVDPSGDQDAESDADADADAEQAPAGGGDTTLRVGAIPDQDPEVLQRQFGLVSDYLANALGVEVEYVPVVDYSGAVTAFATGEIDLVWFGGLTGVQARLQVPDAHAIVQRDIDAEFHSVFIASMDSGLEPFEDVDGLTSLAGKRFTFGSESSTSGRLMPQHFMNQAGLALSDLDGDPGFSGAHDATIALVESGTYDAGALNEQVWIDRSEAGEVDLDAVQVIWRTPPYYDYHWIIHPSVEERIGAGTVDGVTAAFLALDSADPEHAEILDLFGAGSFIETEDANYADIEAVGRDIGLIR